MASATGYDVVFSATNVMPAFPCASCGVVLNTALLVLSDDNTNNLAYAGPSSAGGATVTMNVDNLTESTPFVPVTVNGVSRKMALLDPSSGNPVVVSGTPVVGNCTQWLTTDTIEDTGLPCGAGGGTVDSFETRIGAVVSANGDYTASEVTNVAAGGIAAITVQAALDELDSDKSVVAGSTSLIHAGLTLDFGGSTSGFPMLKRDTTGLQSRLADDSGDAPIGGSVIDATTGFRVNGGATAGEYLRGNNTNFVSAVIPAGDLPTAIDAANIGGGGVSTAEYDFLADVTSLVQVQFDAKKTRVTFALCLGTDCAIDTNLTNVWVADQAYTISKCYAYAKTAPVGSSLTFDINKNGTTTIFSSAFSILTTANAANTTNISAAGTVAESDFFTVDIDAIGSGTAGSNVTVSCVMI